MNNKGPWAEGNAVRTKRTISVRNTKPFPLMNDLDLGSPDCSNQFFHHLPLPSYFLCLPAPKPFTSVPFPITTQVSSALSQRRFPSPVHLHQDAVGINNLLLYENRVFFSTHSRAPSTHINSPKWRLPGNYEHTQDSWPLEASFHFLLQDMVTPASGTFLLPYVECSSPPFSAT